MDSEEREKLIIEQFGGIYPVYEAFYLESLIYAAGRATEAFRRFDQARKRRDGNATIVANVHEALTHSAAVSRFFWPSRKSKLATARAVVLRTAFQVDESSPLFSRALRDALEHYDERLDSYLLQDLVGFIFPGPLVDDAALNDDRMGKVFRLVDPKTQTFILLGKVYEFGPIRSAVETIFARARKSASKGGRLPRDPV